MLKSFRLLHYILPVAAAFLISSAFGQQSQVDVLHDGKLLPGFDIGVNSSEGKTNWLKSQASDLRLSYPSDQTWGAVFITVGPPKDPPRPFRDFSSFNTLVVEMKGGMGQEKLEVGIKSNAQRDNGSETKIPVKLTGDWKPYSFPLGKFEGADLDKLYVAAEFVFSGPEPATIFVRRISYLNTPK